MTAFRVLDGVADLLGMVVEGREGPVSAAAAALHARFAAADALLDALPGADMTRAAQFAEARRLTAALEEKRLLIAKHRELALLTECLAKQPPKAAAAAGAAEEGKDVAMRGIEEAGDAAGAEQVDAVKVSAASTPVAGGDL